MADDYIQLNKGYDGDKLDAWENADDGTKVQRNLILKAGPVKAALCEVLDATGDGSGATDISVDGTSPAYRQLIVPSSNIARIHEVQIVLTDGTGFDQNTFGGIAAIANGLKLESVISSTTVELFNAKVNETLAAFCGNFEYIALAATFMGIFRFKFGPDPLRLIGEDGDKLVLTVRDNLTTLTESLAVARGVWEK